MEEGIFPSGKFPTQFIVPWRFLHFFIHIPGIVDVQKVQVDCFPDDRFANLAKQIHQTNLAFSKKEGHRFEFEYEGHICPDDMYSLYFEAKMQKGS
jgi:hypothetical protein